MRFGCSFLTRSSAFSVTCSAAKVQTEEQPANWKRRVRNKALRKRHQTRRRNEKQEKAAPSSEPEVVPSNDLLWRGEPWSKHRKALQKCQYIQYSETQCDGLVDLTDGSDDAVRITALLECLLFEETYVQKLAVRRVAYRHPQRRVAGVDGVHSLTAAEQRKLCDELGPYLNSRETDPFRFIYLDRAWKKLRPQHRESAEPPERICVCTMRDRVKQVITAWVMEPQCEACYAETNVFGHRPGRSAKELIDWLQTALRGPPTWVAVFKANIASTEKVADFVDKFFPSYPFTGLRSWIQSGLFTLGMYPPGLGREGGEQGCPILPVLSNFLIHRLMKEAGDAHTSIRLASWQGHLISLCPSPARAFSNFQKQLQSVADSMGLEIQMTIPAQPCHKDWVDVCEFSLRQVKIRSDDDHYSAIVRPSATIMERHLQNLSTAFLLSDRFHEDKTGLINRLNPVIDIFTQHFVQTYAGDCFERADTHLKNLLKEWSHRNTRRTQDEAAAAAEEELEGTHNGDLQFRFRTRIARLLRHGDAVRNHSLPPVDKESSPYGDQSLREYRFEWNDWEWHVTPHYFDVR